MRLTTPAAILIGLSVGGLFVAVAVFLAIRENGREANARIASLPLPTLGAPIEPMRAHGETTGGGDARQEALRALDAQRPALNDRCFAPLAAKGAEVRSVSFHVVVGFDADGKQATKLQLMPRTLARPDITDCVTRELAPIAIPAGIGPATVDVVLTVP